MVSSDHPLEIPYLENIRLGQHNTINKKEALSTSNTVSKLKGEAMISAHN
jgi:hypothetical protein